MRQFEDFLKRKTETTKFNSFFWVMHLIKALKIEREGG